MWPNFLAAAKRRNVPVAVVNGRMSPRSFGRYRLLGSLVRALLSRIDLFVMQNAEYAANVRALGADPNRVHVSGSVKYDGVIADRNNPRTRELRELLGVQPDDLIWVAGSTQAPEERIALDAFMNLRERFPTLRLILVPRQRDRFDEVARLLKMGSVPFSRRSALDDPRAPVILVDTIGELRAVWGLADVAFVGGSLDGKRGGQNMIEAAAYGSAVLFGPHVWNFKADAALLLRERAAIQVADAASLEAIVGRLLADAEERRRLGSAAQLLVMQQQGATAHTVELLGRLLDRTGSKSRAA
jgi:3-deoxy-D-manno-octulosonic-acid transferase